MLKFRPLKVKTLKRAVEIFTIDYRGVFFPQTILT